MLLLDEVTSALDSHAELQVQRALLEWAGGRTMLAVAHRLSTVMEFDRVIVLQDGHVVEDGPPSTLRRGTGQFSLEPTPLSPEAISGQVRAVIQVHMPGSMRP